MERVRGRRPLGVAILGGLVLLGAIVLAIAGLAGMFLSFASLLPGSPVPGFSLFLWGLLFFGLSIPLFAAGGGLLAMRLWAWWLAFIVSLGTLIWSGYGLYRTATADEPLELTSLISVTFVAVIFVYLLTVHGAFRPRVTPAQA